MEQNRSNFANGLFSTLTSSTLMMAIYTGVMSIASILFPTAIHFGLMSFLPMAGVVILATGLFGGVMSAMRGAKEAREEQLAAQRGEVREPSRSPEITPAIMPVPALADKAPAPEIPASEQSSWAGRVGAQGTDRVSEILARGGMSDKDRAAAILQARDQAAADQQQAR